MNKSPTHMNNLNTLHLQPAKIGGPPVPRVPNEYSGEPLTQEIVDQIIAGRPFKVGFGTMTSIHRSPRGNDCWYCEHQPDKEYLFHEQNDNKVYPSVISPYDNTRFKCEWYLDTSNMTLVVLATHLFGNRLEVYETNEFGIFLKNAPNYPEEFHDGFHDISPPPEMEMTLMGSTSPNYVD